ncbi:hypothetical protein [Mucilaginibacter pedocola]|uniref:RES domain-containing protein n=1 Tax=Mucilaginibacter pedocola TaxID=1792845 RepID=A0A1S9PMM6_9SPHI|nr:hypothetical protein [Mucilaginibacter pedocola]OOQ62187.1 hypothetical protein BC343_03850 [Mucilaginibacter pedocola]
MNTKELFDHPIFDFPSKTKSSFQSHLIASFETYLGLLKLVDDDYSSLIAQDLDKIIEACNLLEEVVDSYLHGKLASAYHIFAKLMENMPDYLIPPNKNLHIDTHDNFLFKARQEFTKDLGIKEMFHIPFEKRHIVKTNRFSLSGLPCIYLSNSVHTCWEELDRPVFSQMAVSRFKTNHFKYLDLSVNYKFLKMYFVPKWKEQEKIISDGVAGAHKLAFVKFINLFPLYIACYTKVRYGDATFKPEYIIPQMLMQWVAETSEFQGVVYNSTKTKAINNDELFNNQFLNYAIPVKTSMNEGFCEYLSKNVYLTSPISWEMLNISEPKFTIEDLDFTKEILGKVMPPPPILHLNLIDTQRQLYWNTAFGKLEQFLFKMSLKNVEGHPIS